MRNTVLSAGAGLTGESQCIWPSFVACKGSVVDSDPYFLPYFLYLLDPNTEKMRAWKHQTTYRGKTMIFNHVHCQQKKGFKNIFISHMHQIRII